MWTYVFSIYQQVKYIRNCGEKLKYRNRTIKIYQAEYFKSFVEHLSPNLTACNSEITSKSNAELDRFKFLVLAGGGAKAVAYCGVARALEEHGILKDINSIAGTSAGAIMAALLSVGFNSYDIEQIMQADIEGLLKDSLPISKIRNMAIGFGWHAGKKFTEFLGDVLAIKTRNPNITFYELFNKHEKELCIVVTNVNTMCTEYCDSSTTPDMPIRDAVRMSISIPGVMQAVRYKKDGTTSLFVDGGVLCNYPINVYDDDEANRQKNATLGCLVYSEDKQQSIPQDTKLARKFRKRREEAERKKKFNEYLYERLEVETNTIKEIFKAQKETKEFTLTTFKQAWNAQGENQRTDENVLGCTKMCAQMKYGKTVSAQRIFKEIGKKDITKVTDEELYHYCLKTINFVVMKYTRKTYKRTEILGIQRFVSDISKELIPANMKNLSEYDKARTISINTGYIDTLDFAMEKDDITFLIDQGKLSTEEFLRKRNNALKLDAHAPKHTSLTEEDLDKIKNYKS